MLYGPIETSKRLRVGVHDIVFVLTAVSLLCFQMDGFTLDPGLGWHVKGGELIWHSGTIPTTDPFLATPTGGDSRPWVSDQWLSDLFSYLLVRNLSWTGASLVLLSFFVIPFLWFLYREIRSQIGLAISTTVGVFLAAKLASIHLIFRPVIFSFLFLCLIVGRCRRWSTASGGLRGRDYFWTAALFAAWANIHPSFVLGIIWCALVPISRFVERKVGNQTCVGCLVRQELGYFLLPVVAFTATCLNPYGVELHSSIFELTQSPYFMDFHREWQSPNFKNIEGTLAQFIVLVIIGAAFVDRSSGLRYHSFDVLGLLIAGHFALEAVRVLPLFAIVAVAPFSIGCTRLAIALRASFPRSDLLARLIDAVSRVERTERGVPGGAIGIVVVFLILIGVAASKTKFPGVDRVQGPSPAEYPYQAVQYLKTVAQTDLVVVSSPDWGGFITLEGYPLLRPIIDDRNTLLGEAFYRRYFESLKSEKGLSPYLGRFGASYLLLPKDSNAAQHLSCYRGYTLVHKDELAVVFRRDESS